MKNIAIVVLSITCLIQFCIIDHKEKKIHAKDEYCDYAYKKIRDLEFKHRFN